MCAHSEYFVDVPSFPRTRLKPRCFAAGAQVTVGTSVASSLAPSPPRVLNLKISTTTSTFVGPTGISAMGTFPFTRLTAWLPPPRPLFCICSLLTCSSLHSCEHHGVLYVGLSIPSPRDPSMAATHRDRFCSFRFRCRSQPKCCSYIV